MELLASLLEKDGDLYFLQVKGIFQQDPGSVGGEGGTRLTVLDFCCCCLGAAPDNALGLLLALPSGITGAGLRTLWGAGY